MTARRPKRPEKATQIELGFGLLLGSPIALKVAGHDVSALIAYCCVGIGGLLLLHVVYSWACFLIAKIKYRQAIRPKKFEEYVEDSEFRHRVLIGDVQRMHARFAQFAGVPNVRDRQVSDILKMMNVPTKKSSSAQPEDRAARLHSHIKGIEKSVADFEWHSRVYALSISGLVQTWDTQNAAFPKMLNQKTDAIRLKNVARHASKTMTDIESIATRRESGLNEDQARLRDTFNQVESAFQMIEESADDFIGRVARHEVHEDV